MNIISVRYRFLRLNSEQLALVEFYPFSIKPEVCQQLYPVTPYLTYSRLSLLGSIYSTEELEKWVKEQEYSFRLAVSEASNYPDIDFNKSSFVTKEVMLWNYLNPLEEVFWDEYCPLFDNNYSFILRTE